MLKINQQKNFGTSGSHYAEAVLNKVKKILSIPEEQLRLRSYHNKVAAVDILPAAKNSPHSHHYKTPTEICEKLLDHIDPLIRATNPAQRLLPEIAEISACPGETDAEEHVFAENYDGLGFYRIEADSVQKEGCLLPFTNKRRKETIVCPMGHVFRDVKYRKKCPTGYVRCQCCNDGALEKYAEGYHYDEACMSAVCRGCAPLLPVKAAGEKNYVENSGTFSESRKVFCTGFFDLLFVIYYNYVLNF